jgi:Tol biopolymer transport system component
MLSCRVSEPRYANLAAVTVLLACLSAPVLGAEFQQVTFFDFGFGVFEPSLSADGQRVAFRTTGDLTGENPDGSFEVFVYDRVDDGFIQATSTPGGSGTAIDAPVIAPDGGSVVFRSAWDFNSGTPGVTFQLWEVDLDTGVYRQVTDNPPSTPVFDPRVSHDGNFAVFLSRIDPTGGNPNGSLEVFRIDIATGDIIQISDNGSSATAAQFPDVNDDGSVVVWGDRANYDGTNGNGGLEIWKWDQGTGTISSVTRQTASGLETNLPRVDGAGRYVTFVSLFDFSGGGAIGRKVHLADTQTGAITLLTNPGVGGTGEDVPDAEIAPDGSAVYFESNRNLTGENGDGNRELFRYDIAGATLEQVTDTTGGFSIIQLSDDATRHYVEIARDAEVIAYRSEQDLDPAYSNGLANLDLFLSIAPADCVGDLNGDGLRDLADLGILLASYEVDGGGDIDGDGDTDLADLGALLAVYDVPCP